MKRYAFWALIAIIAWWVIQDPTVGGPPGPRDRRVPHPRRAFPVDADQRHT